MDLIVSLRVNRYQLGDVIRALLLIFKPVAAWDLILKARRSPGSLLAGYLLPMMLLAGLAEGFGLVEWGRSQTGIGFHRIHKFAVGEAVVYETLRSLVTLLNVVVCAVLVKMFGETFRERNTYQQTFTMVIYGLSPVFLLRLLDALPGINPWLPWAIGIALSLEVVYRGVPTIMEPDPPNAIGLFFMSGLVLFATSGMERFVTFWYLSGHIKSIETFISNLAAHLPF